METDARDDLEEEVEEVEVPASNGHGDFLSELRKRREEIGADKTHDIDIGGYGGKLVARYRRIEFKEVEKIARAVERMQEKHHPLANLYGQCDLLGRSLVGIYLRKDMAHPEILEPLSRGYGEDGESEALWDEAAKVVAPPGVEVPEAVREQIRLVFNNDLALGAHQTQLSLWLNAQRGEEEEDFSPSS